MPARIYISRGTHVMVIDADTGKKASATIPDTPGGSRHRTGSGTGDEDSPVTGARGTVSIFDIKTLATSSKVKVGDNPDAILYDFRDETCSSHSTAAARTRRQSMPPPGKVLGTIKLDGKPEVSRPAMPRARSSSTSKTRANWFAIDPNKLEVKAKWPLAPCTEPSGIVDRPQTPAPVCRLR